MGDGAFMAGSVQSCAPLGQAQRGRRGGLASLVVSNPALRWGKPRGAFTVSISISSPFHKSTLPLARAGVGSATNGVSIQVGGALGVAVIGSLLSTRYQHHLRSALAGTPVAPASLHTILGSIGGALEVAAHAPGLTAELLVHAAGSAFMSGVGVSLGAGGVVALAGALLALAALPSRPQRRPGDDGEGER